ncbi:MAG: alpha/beta fold hydrolase [Alsobacter sp.]
MIRRLIRLAVLLAAVALPALAGLWPVLANEDVIEESGLVPVKIGGETVRLEMLVVRSRSAGTARLPVVLISHGKPASRADMAAVHATNYRSIAQDFARRGWLAVAVVRRGYGLSEGAFPSAGTCRTGFDLLRQFHAEAEDLAGALAVIAARKEADATRVLALGASNGAMASLALAADQPRAVRAVVNISGGLRNKECPFEDQLVAAFRDLGAKVSAPSLWLYAENDSYFPPAVVSRLKGAYAEGRAPVSFVMLPPVSDDGHRLFSNIEGRLRWWPEVDRFLRTLGLPTWPEGLVDEIMKSQQIDPRHRPSVERYVSAPGEKALVKAANGAAVYWWAGAETEDEAARRALSSCVDKKAQPCQLVLSNQATVGAGATAGNPAAKR